MAELPEKEFLLKWTSNTSTNLELEDVGKYTKDELVKAVGDQQVVEVWIDGAIPDTVYSWSSSLKKLTLVYSSVKEDLERLPELINLETLQLSGSYVRLSDNIFQPLSSLKELLLDNCSLSSLPKSVEKLTSLKRLDLSGNSLGEVPECIGSLKSLKWLKLRECGLETLPKSMSQLVSLEELDLSYNDFSTNGLPDVVMDLSGLKKLFLPFCQLDVLLTRESCLLNLELLDLNFNRFEDHGLPEEVFANFPNLAVLRMDECRLKSLPKSIEKLSDLEELSLAGNRFETFPGTRKLTEKLKKLNLSRNGKLRLLNEEMVQIEKLNVDDCKSLNSPPYKLFRGGIEAVKQYFGEMARNPNRHIPFTVIVLGYSQAGKSSLVKTLQSETNQRILTNRKDGDEQEIWFDTATKVFSFEEVTMKNGQVLKFIDFGGHEIYQVTYQLTFREKCVVILVVSMKQFEEMSEVGNPNEAVRALAINWLAYLYTPTLLPPKLVIVFTHEDQFSKEKFAELKDHFLYLMKEMWSQEANAEPDFLADAKVYSIGEDGEFDDMKSALLEIAQSQTKGYKPPESWQNIRQFLELQKKPFCRLDQILKGVQDAYKVPEVDAKKVLGLMHDCGLLLWYKDNPSLERYVFPDINQIVDLLVVLYDHKEKDKWVKRVRNFHSFRQDDGLFLGKEVFDKLVGNFHKTGIIDRALFRYLISTESSFEKSDEIELAFEMLCQFRLVYGPIDEKHRPAFLVPNFSRGRVKDFEERKAELNFQVDIQSEGLALPMYRHHQMTIDLLNAFPPNENAVDAKYNGVFIETKMTTIGLIHNRKSKKVSLQVRGVASAVVTCWSQLLKSSKAILDSWNRESTGYKCWFYCPHCLLKNDLHPEKSHPSWCRGNEEAARHPIGLQNASCGEDRDIPPILTTPSSKISSRAMKELMQYVAKIEKEQKDVETAKSPKAKETTEPEELYQFKLKPEDESELSDEEVDDELLYPLDDEVQGGIVGLRPAPTRMQKVKNLFNDTEKVYEVSSPHRGRALIIYNGSKVAAHQSQTDLQNVGTFLNDFDFEIVVKQNLTTEAMMESIKHETRNPHHADYSMFVLVIICHQSPPDGVIGQDDRVVDQTVLCRLMSGKNFPLMDKKPKLVIIHNSQEKASLPRSQSFSDSCEKKRPFPISDMIFVRSDGEAAYSWRSQAVGSLFVRCLVMTFYQHASHRDIATLLEIVKQKVERTCAELDTKLGKSLIHPKVNVCSTTGRMAHLFPHYNGPRKSWSILNKLGSP